MRKQRLVLALLMVATLAGGALARTPHVRAAGACFQETGFCIQGRFLAYWQANGDLARNGYPLTDERQETLEDGQTYTVQYFERVRLEYHPENPTPYDVLLGQFGRRILLEEYVVARENYPVAVAPVTAQPGQAYFPETGHNISPLFLAYWQANGGLAQFGYPLTEERWDTLGTGASACCRTQYFERARFEYHPENAGTPYTILLGQFGRRILEEDALLTGPLGQLFAGDERVRGLLGRPTGPATTSDGAAQAFERGLLLYEGAGRRIFVLCGDPQAGMLVTSGQYPTERQFPAFADTWQEGDDPGGGAGPTAGLYLPRRGFGKVWRENPGAVKGCVGYATTPGETGYRIIMQAFAGGFMLTDPQGGIYVIPTIFGKCCGLGGSYQRYAIPAR